MCYEIKKPITDKQRADFIVEYNHTQGLRMEDTEMFLFALEPDEIMGEKEIEIDVSDFDEDGNPIGEHEETITKHVQKTHKETITVPYPVKDPDYEEKQLAEAKVRKNAENVSKAKSAIDNGFVEFKNAQFETNAQTVGDLTATMLMLQASGQESYEWLSRDDKTVELTAEDFVTLGGIIAAYKNTVWNDKYIGYKDAIKNAKTVKEVNEIVIDYTITAVD